MKHLSLSGLLLVSLAALTGCVPQNSSSTSNSTDSPPPTATPETVATPRTDTPPPPPVLRPPSAAKPVATQTELEAAGARFGPNSHVDLSNCQDVNPILSKLTDITQPKRISIAGENANDATFVSLYSIPSIERLDLPEADLTANSAGRLASLSKLNFLNLPKANLPLQAVKQLAQIHSLKQLRCAESTIDDASLEQLATVRSLQAIDLSHCQSVSAKGVSQLTACPQLKFLKLAGQSVDDGYINSIGDMKSLKVLGLNDTSISDEGFARLSVLDLSEVQLVRSPIGDSSIEALSGMKNLAVVNLRNTKISDAALSHLTQCGKLKKLEVSECSQPGITDIGCQHLAKIQSLENVQNLRGQKVRLGIASLLVIGGLLGIACLPLLFSNPALKVGLQKWFPLIVVLISSRIVRHVLHAFVSPSPSSIKMGVISVLRSLIILDAVVSCLTVPGAMVY